MSGLEQAMTTWYRLETSRKDSILLKMPYIKKCCIHVRIRLDYGEHLGGILGTC